MANSIWLSRVWHPLTLHPMPSALIEAGLFGEAYAYAYSSLNKQEVMSAEFATSSIVKTSSRSVQAEVFLPQTAATFHYLRHQSHQGILVLASLSIEQADVIKVNCRDPLNPIAASSVM